MEEYLIFAAIGGLLFLTLLVNSVSEAYEQNKRERRIQILKIKQGLDELSDLMDQLKNCGLPKDINDLLLNEIMTRLQVIQRIDRHFRGIQALIEEAKEEGQTAATATTNQEGFNLRDENEFKKKLIKLGRLIKLLNTSQWYVRVKPEHLRQMNKDAKLLRCEKVFQFYSNRASREIEQKNFLSAKEDYIYIKHALQGSGINSNTRIIELLEQVEFMIEQVNDMFANNAKKMMEQEEEEPESTQEEASNQESEVTANNVEHTMEQANESPPQQVASNLH